MAMTYSDYTTALGDLLQYIITSPASSNPSNDANFNAILPRCIEYAEQRMYREFDMITTVEASIVSLTPASRNVTLPTGMIVLESLNVVTPAATNPDSGTRINLQGVSIDWMNICFPSATTTGVPQYYANLNNTTIYLGPTPDQNYKAEFIGTFRPDPLSSTNTTTLLTNYIPDVFLAASMVFMAGYQRDMGAQFGSAASAQYWEAQYQALSQSAYIEIQRQKSQGPDWEAFSPAPLANQNAMAPAQPQKHPGA